MKHKFKIDNSKCIKCGLCVSDCLSGAIDVTDNQDKYIDMVKPERCIQCEHCFSICPAGAISIMGFEADETVDENIDSNQILNLIKTRRSIRKYKKENVSKDLIEKLKLMLNYTPTGCNNHKLSFSFVEDMEVMDDLRTKVNDKLKSVLSKEIFKPFNNTLNKFTRNKNAILKGEDIIFRDAPHIVVVSAPIDSPCPNQDGIIALSYFELYAQALGIGTCWCGFGQAILKLFPEFCEYLKIPKGYSPIYMMLFGYSNVKYKRPIKPREYSFITIEKQENNKINIFSKIKRFFWNFIR